MKIFLLLIMSVFLLGCNAHALKSRPETSFNITDEAKKAELDEICTAEETRVNYSLPRALVPLSLKFGPAVLQPNVEQAAKIKSLQTAIEGLNTALKKASEEVDVLTMGKIETEIDKKKEALKTLRKEASGPGFVASAGNAKIYADPSRSYSLCYKRESFSDDVINIKTTASGLLSEVSVSSDDRRDDVARKVAESLIEVANLSALGGLSGLSSAIPKSVGRGPASLDEIKDDESCTKKAYDITVMIDPTDHIKAQKVIDTALAVQGVKPGCVIFYPSPIPAAGDDIATAPKDDAKLQTLCSQGACYARAAPAAFNVSKPDANKTFSFSAELPNNGPVGVVDFKRAAFVKVDAKATFSNGMLTEFSYTKPSSALAIASLPVDLLKSLVSIPKAAFETKAAAVEAKASLLTAQAKVFAEQNKLSQASELTAIENEIAKLELLQKQQALIPAPLSLEAQAAAALESNILLLELEGQQRELLQAARPESSSSRRISLLEQELRIIELEQAIEDLLEEDEE